jgi:hypothetical protein
VPHSKYHDVSKFSVKVGIMPELTTQAGGSNFYGPMKPGYFPAPEYLFPAQVSN